MEDVKTSTILPFCTVWLEDALPETIEEVFSNTTADEDALTDVLAIKQEAKNSPPEVAESCPVALKQETEINPPEVVESCQVTLKQKVQSSTGSDPSSACFRMSQRDQSNQHSSSQFIINSCCPDLLRHCDTDVHKTACKGRSIQNEDTAPTLTCDVCSAEFISKCNLIKHVFSHNETVMPPSNICETCGEVFASKIFLMKHSQMCHLKNKEGKSFGSGVRTLDHLHSTVHVNDEAKEITVERESDFSESKIEKFKHIKNKNSSCRVQISNVCNINDQQHCVSREKANRCDNIRNSVINIPKHKHHKHTVKGKLFSQTSSSHNRGKTHNCEFCGKSFSIPYHLKTHKRIHTGERPYKCDICGKAFSHRQTLILHKRTHTGEKPHKCDVCGKVFSYNTNLKTHKLIHTGEKRFECDICGRRFTQNNLTNHKRSHTGDKPYKCNICEKPFSSISYLKIHKRVHTGEKPFKCEDCGKSFAFDCSFRFHKHIHTGKKPYKCSICERPFSNKWALQVHQVTHNAEKPFECDICGRPFLRNCYLKQHKQTHNSKML